ncbi:hypothetical protein HKX48_000988 [Thoreauomyces humboldtii]|nr:hypothetical protein HKX48_000988 [Thoreauomyces humboldtii]
MATQAKKKSPPQVDVDKAVGFKVSRCLKKMEFLRHLPTHLSSTEQYPSDKVAYTRHELLVYAAGLNITDLRYTYELDKQFSAFPTYPLVLPLKGASQDVNSYAKRSAMDNVPGMPEIDLRRLVHGEQYYEALAPLPAQGEFNLESTLVGVFDAGKGMIMDRETVMKDKAGKPIAKMASSTTDHPSLVSLDVSSAFVIGFGGFGGPRKPKPANAVATPATPPDAVDETPTTPNQALLYRLSGDYNPLHADGRIGKALGMNGAILHGLCSFGISAAAVLRRFGNNDPAAFKSIYGRFAAPVYPGETLRTNMWKVPSDGQVDTIAFVTSVKRDGKDVIVIAGGTVRLNVLGGSSAGASKL